MTRDYTVKTTNHNTTVTADSFAKHGEGDLYLYDDSDETVGHVPADVLEGVFVEEVVQ